jgi:hypothetical protein
MAADLAAAREPKGLKLMSRGAWRFRSSEVTRVVKAVAKAGCEVVRAEIEPSTGKIVVIVGKSQDAPEGNDLDRWMASRDARQA